MLKHLLLPFGSGDVDSSGEGIGDGVDSGGGDGVVNGECSRDVEDSGVGAGNVIGVKAASTVSTNVAVPAIVAIKSTKLTVVVPPPTLFVPALAGTVSYTVVVLHTIRPNIRPQYRRNDQQHDCAENQHTDLIHALVVRARRELVFEIGGEVRVIAVELVDGHAGVRGLDFVCGSRHSCDPLLSMRARDREGRRIRVRCGRVLFATLCANSVFDGGS
jgi:hypothetical protein